MLPSHLRVLHFLVGVLVFALATVAVAETPDSIVIMKAIDHRQTSATQSELQGYHVYIGVDFPANTPAGTRVQLSRSGVTTLILTRDSATSYSFANQYSTEGDLNRALPDGRYTLSVSGGATGWSVLVDINPRPFPQPGLVLYFDQLQGTPYSTNVNVFWNSVPDPPGNRVRTLAFQVEGPGGERIPADDEKYGYRDWGTIYGPLPYDVPVTGHITYAQFPDSGEIVPGVAYAIGNGYHLSFPVRHAIPKPRFTSHPVSRAVGAGGDLTLDAGISWEGLPSGTPHSYQWYQDDVPLAGATQRTLHLTQVDLAQAGRYHVVVTNAAGSTASEKATVLVGGGLDITTVVGTAEAGSSDGTGTAARFSSPTALTVDGSGNVYIIDAQRTTIRKVTPAGVVSTLAGTPGATGSVDGTGAAARFNQPEGIAADRDGNVYVSDTGNATVRKITPQGVVSTLAGNAGQPGFADGTGGAARFEKPFGIAVDAAGNVYVVDSRAAGAIRKITPAGVVTTLAGGGASSPEGDGEGPAAVFYYPQYLTLGLDGLLYTRTYHGLRAVTTAGVVRTSARFDLDSFAVDGTGAVIRGGNRIEQLRPAGKSVLLAGGTLTVHRDGFGRAAGLLYVIAVAIDRNGTMYALDRNRLRKGVYRAGAVDGGNVITQQPLSVTLAPGTSTLSLHAGSEPLTTTGNWYRNGNVIGTGPRLVIRNVTTTLAGEYWYVAENEAGAAISRPARVEVSDTATPGRILNLSIRATAGAGAKTLIAGLALAATSDPTPRPLLIRGVGPGLAPHGVTSFVPDPALALFHGSSLLAGNDDWAPDLATTFNKVQAFPLAPGSRDAALQSTLGTGTYTAQLTAKSGSGIGLAEIYELNSVPGALRLINVSARTQVGAGEDVLIAGFVLGGSTAKTVLIRAVGPSLAAHGIPAADCLADPRLDLYAGSTWIDGNDRWDEDTQVRYIGGQVYAFDLPWGSKDAALIITLPPGAYTMKVSGANGSTGIALAEVYEVP